MQQHLFSVLLAMILNSSISASTSLPSNASTPAATSETSSEQVDRGHASGLGKESPSSNRPLVVRVRVDLGEALGPQTPVPDPATSPFETDWDRIELQLTRPDAGGDLSPLAFLIQVDGTVRPFEVPPFSGDAGESGTADVTAIEKYGTRLAQTLDGILKEARHRYPGRPLSIVGLPIERPTAGQRALAEVLNPITEQLDVLVSGRTLLQLGDGVSSAMLRNALPTTTSNANGRPVYYRTLQGWTSWRSASVAADSGSEASNEGRGAPEVSPPAERPVTGAEQRLALDSSSSEPAFVDDADLASRRHATAWSTDQRPLTEVSDEYTGTAPVGASVNAWPDEDMGGDEPEAGSALWSSDGRDETSIPTESDTPDSRTNGDDPSTRSSSPLRELVGSSATIPTATAPPTLFPYLGSMEVGVGTDTSLSDLLIRLAATTSPATSGRSLTSRGSSAGAPGSSAAGNSSLGSSPDVARGGGSVGSRSGGGGTSTTSSAGGGASGRIASGTAASASAMSNPSNASGPSSTAPIVIPIAPSGSSSTVSPPASQTPANTNNLPNAEVPDSPTWNPSSGVTPTTPIGATSPVANSDSGDSANAYRFGRHTDDPVWGYWACEPFRTSDGRLWIGVSAYAAEGIDSVRFLVTGLGATSVSEVDYHPDRSLDAYWIDIRPGDVTGSQVAVTAIVNTSGVTDPLESPPLVVEKRNGVWDVPASNNGWTVLTPSPDSRLVYVATDGNDVEASSNQHGRRYYLPSDPEIGGDPQNPAQPQNIKAYKTISRAVVPIRGHRWRSETNNVDDYGLLWARPEDPTEHHPDWLLFRRGQTFPSEDYATTIGGPYVSDTNNNIINMLIQHGTGEQVGGSRAGYWGGRSESERAVITAWGVSDSEPRPVLEDDLTINDVTGNIAITSIEGRIDFLTGTDPRPWDNNRTGTRNVLIEDCKGVGGGTNLNWWTDITIRRCTIVDASSADGHVQGLFLSTPDNYNSNSDEPPTWVIEECVFDRNGYKEDVNEPTTWTRSVAVDLGLSGYGTGYQPNRTFYDRNLYGATYDSLLLRGNIFSRGGGGGSVQMRSGGVAERNLFIWNPSHLAVNSAESYEAYWNSSLITDNCFLHFDHLLPPGAHDNAIGTEAHVFPVVIADNVFAKSHRTTGSYAMIRMLAKTESSKSPASPADTIIVVDNDLHLDGGKEAFSILDTGDIRTLVVRDNALYSGDQKDTNLNWHFAALMGSNWSSAQGITGEPWDIGSNDYFSDASAYGFRFQRIDKTQPYDLSQWQAAGFGIGSTIHPSKAALSTAAGWTDPDRSILTYMQAVDPTYVVDENVYVDDDTTGQKQANRVEVWKVLSAEDQTDPHQEGVFTTADAKQIAREYHAFISFIQKARANRKGAWDSRWTADAVNNYIREGYGKEPVTGPYTASLDDIASYIPVTP